MRVTELPCTGTNHVYTLTAGSTSRTVTTRATSGFIGARWYCVLYDDEWNIIERPSAFLTDALSAGAPNTQHQAISAIKTLCNFEQITGLDFAQMSLTECRAFLQFLRGTLSWGTGSQFALLTARAETTVAAYLKFYRAYAEWLHCTDHPLQKARSEREGSRDITVSARPRQSTEAPRYITPEQYRAVLAAASARDDLQARVICRLMYEHGLRIGEVLGLTLEDVHAAPTAEGPLVYSVVLRNHLSDRQDQSAKNLLHPTASTSYTSADYRRPGTGYHRVYLSESVFQDLVDYIELVRPAPNSVADSATGARANGYVFLNTRGRPLSATSWNRRLRTLMFSAGVPVDSQRRQTNLNHRFRHGYAMALIKIARVDDFTLKTLMRHRSLASTAPYHNPSEEDVHAMQEAVTRSLASAIFGAADVT